MKIFGSVRIAACSGAALLSLAAGLQAQPTTGTTSAEETTSTTPPPSAPTTPPPSADAQGNGDIIVTAQRRSERLSEIPLTVNVRSSASLAAAGVVNFKELGQVTPGLNFTFIGGAAQPTVRGISSESTAAGAENNVAIYVDGIYQSNIYGNSFDLPDVDRVEVLKGPQGTLYGRNATGGAILVSTRNPEFTPTGSFEVSDGRFSGGANDFRAKGFVTGPITDTLAASISGQYADNEGYFHDVLRDKRAGKITSKNVRGKLLWKPGSGVSLLLNAYYSKRRDESVFADQNIDSPFPDVPTRKYDIANDTVGFVATESYGINLRTTIDTDAGTLTSLTGYVRVKPHAVADSDGSPTPATIYDLNQPGKTISEDISFASKKFSIFSFIAGGTAYHGREDFSPLAVRATLAGPTFYSIDSSSIADAFAGFAEGTAQITPTLTLTGGIRYSYENRIIKASLTGENPPPKIGEASFRAWTPRASIRYSPSRDYSFYFSYGKGFKSGLFDTSAPSTTPVKPENLTSYEAGFKISPVPGFSLNGAVYRYDVSNLQTQTNNEAGLAVLANAGKARIEGAELELDWRVTPDLRLNAGAAYIPIAKYEEYLNAAFVTPTAGGGGANAVADLSGTRIAKTPKWQANATASYQKELPWGTIGASTNVTYSSYFFYELSRTVAQDKYAMVSAQLSWSPPASGLKVSVWGKNLTNKATLNNYLVNAAGFLVVYQAPREIGLSLGYSF
jgi:iron complex outermembrane receptor protein